MVELKIIELVSEQMNIDIETITKETRIREDLNADSLDAVELVMTIEDEFSIEVEDEDVTSFKTLGDIIEYLETKV